jgi:predicted restriction endonuclease
MHKRTSLTFKDNPNYRHGRNQSSARTSAKIWYPQACIVCGFDVVVEIHHILPKAEGGDNDPANLAVLCPNHHAMAELSLLSRDELFEYARAARIPLQE